MTQQGGDAIAELKKAVIDQKKANLPPEAEEPVLIPLHEAISDYDRLVSQQVIAVIQGWENPLTDADIQYAQARSAYLLQSPEFQGHRKLSIYRAYQARLDRMLELVKLARWQANS